MKKRQHTGLWVLACCPLSIRVLTYEVFIENVGREKRNRTALQYITAIPYPRYSPPHEEGAYLQEDCQISRCCLVVSDTLCYLSCKDCHGRNLIAVLVGVVTYGESAPYVYCIDSDCGPISYHRFSRRDYLAFGFGGLDEA